MKVGAYLNIGIVTRKMAYNYIAVFNSEGNSCALRSHEGNLFSLGLDGTVVWNEKFLMKGNCTVMVCYSIRIGNA
jgi:hypothetical protein